MSAGGLGFGIFGTFGDPTWVVEFGIDPAGEIGRPETEGDLEDAGEVVLDWVTPPKNPCSVALTPKRSPSSRGIAFSSSAILVSFAMLSSAIIAVCFLSLEARMLGLGGKGVNGSRTCACQTPA